jgi:hypothetical protein
LPNANFEEIGLHIPSMIAGTFYDFTPKWYTAVGYKIIQTMLIVAFWPFFELSMIYSSLWLKRKIDGSWGSDSYKTKKTNMQ